MSCVLYGMLHNHGICIAISRNYTAATQCNYRHRRLWPTTIIIMIKVITAVSEFRNNDKSLYTPYTSSQVTWCTTRLTHTLGHLRLISQCHQEGAACMDSEQANSNLTASGQQVYQLLLLLLLLGLLRTAHYGSLTSLSVTTRRYHHVIAILCMLLQATVAYYLCSKVCSH